MGRVLDSVKARVRTYVQEQQKKAGVDAAVQRVAKERAGAAERRAYVNEQVKMAGARGKARAQAQAQAQGGGGLRGAFGTFATGFEGGLLGGSGAFGSAPPRPSSRTASPKGPATYVKVGGKYLRVVPEERKRTVTKGTDGITAPDFGALSGLSTSKKPKSIDDLLL